MVGKQVIGRLVLKEADEPLLEKMAPDFRAILLETGPYEDIAARLGVAVGTVKSRRHRARAALLALREASP